MGETLTRAEARRIADGKLRELSALSPRLLLERYGLPQEGGFTAGADEIDPRSGKEYACVVQVLEVVPDQALLLLVFVSPRQLTIAEYVRWFRPVRRKARITMGSTARVS